MDRRRLDNRAEGLVVVDARLLGEAADDLARFVPSQSPIEVELVFEQPLVGDDIGTRRSRFQAPGAIGEESIVFHRHCSTPVGDGKGAAIVGQDRGGSRGGEAEAVDQMQTACLQLCHRARGCN